MYKKNVTLQKKKYVENMRKIIVPFLFLLFLLLIAGCNGCQDRLQKEYSIFLNKEIKLPAFVKGIYKNRDTVYLHQDDVMTRMVVFFDSTTCSSCQVARIWEWERITSYAKAMKYKFEPVFIFAPPKQQEHETVRSLRVQSFSWPVYVDADQSFLSSNEEFPQNKVFHVFLLDKNNKVVLVGDPTFNTKLWEIYKKTIVDLIENGGVLRPEATFQPGRSFL